MLMSNQHFRIIQRYIVPGSRDIFSVGVGKPVGMEGFRGTSIHTKLLKVIPREQNIACLWIFFFHKRTDYPQTLKTFMVFFKNPDL